MALASLLCCNMYLKYEKRGYYAFIAEYPGHRAGSKGSRSKRRRKPQAPLFQILFGTGSTPVSQERERAAWIASAKEGIADEARHLEMNGPSLARFRQAVSHPVV